MEKIDLARKKQSDLINNEEDYFILSIGLDGYNCCWDEKSDIGSINLILHGLSISIARCLSRSKEYKHRHILFNLLIQNILKFNEIEPDFENLLNLFKNKFYLFTSTEKDRYTDVTSSGDVDWDEMLALWTYTYYIFVRQLTSSEQFEFLEKMTNAVEGLIKEINIEALVDDKVKYSDLHFEEGDRLQKEADSLYFAEDKIGALEKMSEAIKVYEMAFEKYKILRGIDSGHTLILEGSPIAHAYFSKAKILFGLGKTELAFNCQDKAIELDPNNQKYY